VSAEGCPTTNEEITVTNKNIRIVLVITVYRVDAGNLEVA